MSPLEALILGIIQGLTEFLPVSSSGHLELGSVLLDIQTTDNLLFAVVVHFATAVATIVVFRKDIGTILRDLVRFEWNESTRFAFKILLSMVPVFLVGIFFKDVIEGLFTGNVLLVGSMLLITGGLLLFAHFRNSGQRSVGFGSGLIIGIAQAVAILPGVSRSGATIATALLLGVERSKAARFSFLMVLIPILGASFLELLDYSENPAQHQIQLSSLVTGFMAAFVSGFLACRWMLTIVKKGKLTYFAIYCMAAGLLAIVLG